MGPMSCGHGLFQKAVISEPAAADEESWGETVVPGLLQARLGSEVLVMGLSEKSVRFVDQMSVRITTYSNVAHWRWMVV
jgi:hypothetical protein